MAQENNASTAQTGNEDMPSFALALQQRSPSPCCRTRTFGVLEELRKLEPKSFKQQKATWTNRYPVLRNSTTKNRWDVGPEPTPVADGPPKNPCLSVRCSYSSCSVGLIDKWGPLLWFLTTTGGARATKQRDLEGPFKPLSSWGI